MAKRLAALGIVVFCVVSAALGAAGLPAVTVEAAGSEGPVQSENSSLGSGGGSFSGKENKTYSVFSRNEEPNTTQSMIAGLVQGATSGLPSGFSGGEGGGDESDAQSERTSLLTVPEAVFGVAALATVAAVLTLRSVSTSTDETTTASGTDGGGDTEAVAVAASRAADAVADAEGDQSDLSNAVYRAWHEMTTALDVADPETATPGEFAVAAHEAGLDPDAVADLTTVFEAVRYGDEPVDDHEERALAALRQVEREGDVGGDDGGDSR
jgi:hypothetical protein